MNISAGEKAILAIILIYGLALAWGAFQSKPNAPRAYVEIGR